MTRDDNRSTDLTAKKDEAILAELDRLYSAHVPPHLRDGVDRTVFSRMAAPTPARNRRLRVPSLSRVPVALVTGLAVVLGGLASISRLSAPTMASAQSVLHRAAAVRMSPNEAMHLTYAVTVSVPGQGTEKALLGGMADVWIESDGNGRPVRSSQMLTLAVKNLSSRYIQEGGETYSYNPELRGDNTIAIAPEARSDPSWLVPNHLFDGASVAAYLNGEAGSGTRLLPQQTLDGHTVDAVRVDGGPNRPALRTTFYFDAQTYLLRGFDAVGIDPSYPMPSWRARLTGEVSLPASAEPAGIFKLNAPTARVELPAPVSFDGTFRGVCHTSLNFKQAVVSGRTPLAVCGATNPSMTQAELVDALVNAVGSDLPIAMNAGQITPAQESEALQALRTQITAMVTSAGPARVATPGAAKG